MAEIKLRQLSKDFGVGDDKVTALQDVSFDVSGHVFTSIVGPSGCGKSTLLNILSGIETPSSGSVEPLARIVAPSGAVVAMAGWKNAFEQGQRAERERQTAEEQAGAYLRR